MNFKNKGRTIKSKIQRIIISKKINSKLDNTFNTGFKNKIYREASGPSVHEFRNNYIPRYFLIIGKKSAIN